MHYGTDMKKIKNNPQQKTIVGIEKGLLGLIALLTIVATGQELITIIEARKVDLADYYCYFIYTEVLGMIGVFYASNRISLHYFVYCNDGYSTFNNTTR